MPDIGDPVTYNEIMDGGIVDGGAAVHTSVFIFEPSGSILLEGQSISGYGFSFVSQGSALLGGEALSEIIFNFDVASNGASLSGLLNLDAVYEVYFTGGCQLSGESPNEHGLIASGGISNGSSAVVEFVYNLTSSNGINSNGISDLFVIYNPVLSYDATKLSGNSFVQTSILMLGGIINGGQSDLTISYLPSGGINGNGQSDVTSFVNEPPNGVSQGGINTNGNALSSQQRIIPAYLASGQIIIEGSADAGIKAISYQASGSVSIQPTEARVNFTFEKSTVLNWRLNSYVIKDSVYLWNLGQLKMYWYRVVGKGTQDPCLPQEPCCQKFILNVHARSLAELCEKLSKRRYKFPIDTVQRFSRPAENAVVAEEEASGINHDCNTLIDLEVCNIPECADFCVDQDVLQPIGFSISVQVNAFQEFTASGNVSISGFASASFTKNLPNYVHATTGSISLNGVAESYADHVNMRGGCRLQGTAKIACSRWSFVGGLWPYQTNQLFGTDAKSVSQGSQQQLWSLPERILSDNGLYSSTDISYGKKSQALLANDFRLKIPTGSKILQIVIAIDRKASSTTVRDREIYLMLNDQQISENLAVTNTSWPLIETKKIYAIDVGSHGWANPLFEFQVPPQKIWNLDDLDPNDLNDSNFGVSLSIENTSNVKAIARVDYISVQVIYEDLVHGIVRISTDGAKFVGPTYHYAGSGKVSISGNANNKVKKKFNQKLLGAGIKLGGKFAFVDNYVSEGGIALSGNALVVPYIEEPSGGLKITTIEAYVNPAWYTMQGGLKAQGLSNYKSIYDNSFLGGALISGSAIVTSEQFFYSSTGSIGISGTSRIRSSSRSYASSGSLVNISGNADIVAGSFPLENESIGFDMTIYNLVASFLTDVELNNLTEVNERYNKCGCYNLPQTMELYHNFATNNSFAKFLVRNGLTISNTLFLKYNQINDSWQDNIHYKGLSFDNNSYETWDVTSELSCTNTMGGVVLGTSVWRLAVQFFKKNLTTNEFYDSRILVAVIPDVICRGLVTQLDFLVEYDTQNKFATVTPNATIFQNTIFDNIGLFKNPAWVDNPVLRLKISQAGTIKPQQRLDLTSTVLG